MLFFKIIYFLFICFLFILFYLILTFSGTPLEHAVCRDEPVFRDGSNSVNLNAPNGSNNCSAGLSGFGQNRYEGFGQYMTQDQYSLPQYQTGGMYGNLRHILREMEVFGFEK